MYDDNTTENGTDQQADEMSREERCSILEEVWGLDGEEEEWPGDREQEQMVETIYAENTAYVEDFRIRPVEVSDEELRMHARMQVGGGEGVYIVLATVQYGGDDEGHHVVVYPAGGERIIDEFDVDFTTASPEDTFDATNAVHETYLAAKDDWYDYAVAADEAGD